MVVASPRCRKPPTRRRATARSPRPSAAPQYGHPRPAPRVVNRPTAMRKLPCVFAWSIMLVSLATAAGAAPIYQCLAPDGSRGFQDRPCGGSAHAATVVSFDGERREPNQHHADPAEAARIAAWEQASRDRLPESLGGRARKWHGSATGRPSRANRLPTDACTQARAEREAAYRTDSNRMGFDRRRALHDAVLAACGLR